MHSHYDSTIHPMAFCSISFSYGDFSQCVVIKMKRSFRPMNQVCTYRIYVHTLPSSLPLAKLFFVLSIILLLFFSSYTNVETTIVSYSKLHRYFLTAHGTTKKK